MSTDTNSGEGGGGGGYGYSDQKMQEGLQQFRKARPGEYTRLDWQVNERMHCAVNHLYLQAFILRMDASMIVLQIKNYAYKPVSSILCSLYKTQV